MRATAILPISSDMPRNRTSRPKISVVVALTGIIAAAGTLTACSGSSRSLEVAPKTSTSQPSEPDPTTDSDPYTPTTPRKCVVGQATVQRDVSYGPAALDIFPTAKRCGAPVLIFVHGGGYCCGDKTQIGEQVIRWSNEQGYTFVAVDYRLRVQYPTFDRDVAKAIVWVRTHASTFGADGDRIALMGHSTGGSMAAELATTPSLYPTADGIKALDCVMLLDPSSLDLAGKMANQPSRGSAALIRRVYGTEVLGWKSASAWDNADDSDNVAKFLIAARGRQSAEQNRFADRLRENASTVQIVDASNLNHGQVMNNIGRTGDRTMTLPVKTFLNDCLG